MADGDRAQEPTGNSKGETSESIISIETKKLSNLQKKSKQKVEININLNKNWNRKALHMTFILKNNATFFLGDMLLSFFFFHFLN